MNKKIKSWVPALFVLAAVFSYKYYRVSRLDSFATGKITECYETKPHKYVTKYDFFVNGEKYNGEYYGLNKAEDNNQYFLILYSKYNPNISFISFKNSSKEKINIDSFSRCCKPRDFIKLLNY